MIKNNNISVYSYYLLMLFLPLSLLFGNIFLGILFLSILFQKEKPKKVNNIISWSLIVFVGYVILNGILNSSFVSELDNYKMLIPLILIPYCINNMEKKALNRGFIFLVFGILYIQFSAFIGIIDYYYFTDGKKYALKNYSKINNILYYERPYLGYFSVLNIIISYYIFKKLKKKTVAILIFIISLMLIIIISARLSILTVFLLTIIVAYIELNKNQKVIVFCCLTGLLTLFFFNKSSLKSRFLQINKDARVVIWSGAYSSFQKTNNHMLGSGSQVKTRTELLNHYMHYQKYESTDERNRFIKKNYNTHNQYINELLRGGILGLIIFTFPQLFNLFWGFKRVDKTFNLLLLISILSFCMVENILERQIGVYLYALILSWSIKKKNKVIC